MGLVLPGQRKKRKRKRKGKKSPVAITVSPPLRR